MFVSAHEVISNCDDSAIDNGVCDVINKNEECMFDGADCGTCFFRHPNFPSSITRTLPLQSLNLTSGFQWLMDLPCGFRLE